MKCGESSFWRGTPIQKAGLISMGTALRAGVLPRNTSAKVQIELFWCLERNQNETFAIQRDPQFQRTPAGWVLKATCRASHYILWTICCHDLPWFEKLVACDLERMVIMNPSAEASKTHYSRAAPGSCAGCLAKKTSTFFSGIVVQVWAQGLGGPPYPAPPRLAQRVRPTGPLAMFEVFPVKFPSHLGFLASLPSELLKVILIDKTTS